MLKMSSQIENIVSAYKTLSKIPSIVGGRLNNSGTKITSKWSVRNLDKGKSSKYLHSYVLDDSLNVVTQSDFGTDVSTELLSAVSPRETLKAVIREVINKESKKQYLEVWDRASLAHSFDLTALDLHGDVYTDSELGSIDWLQDESAIVYIAEKKLKKSEPYIKRKSEDKSKPDGSGESPPKKGEEYVYRQDWGEQLVGQYMSVIVVCNIQAETFSVLEGLPETCCPGQVRFAPDGRSVYGVAWETEPRRLGLIFCSNRPGFIFELSLDGTISKLSAAGAAVRSPRANCRGDLVWLQRAAGGPHHACHAIVRRDKHTGEVSTVVDIVDTETRTANGASFHGMYRLALPRECFSSDGTRLVFSTPQQNEERAYVVDLDGGRIVDISNASAPGSTAVLDVKSDVILAVCSNMTTPGQLYVARLPSRGAEADIQWVRVSAPLAAPAPVAASTVEYLQLEHKDSTDSVNSFSALYFAPKGEDKLPLVVWPHGGPHSSFTNAFSLEAALFNMLGFACLQINYRGSAGAGQASVQYLPKRVGDADVKDCRLATDHALRTYPVDGARLCLWGGSHGGFLVAHLSGQYPDTYRAVVARNPVIDVASMFNSTDIADWCWASVRINFRGSTGRGDRNVRALVGRVGSYDVSDCLLTLTALTERDARVEPGRDWLLYGGSYGGFVTAHLAGQHPDLFRAMVMRNPLIDLATKGHYADNSDGCAVEAGWEFSERGPVSEEQLLAMRRCSPLVHVHKVKAPTALMLGAGDKRVPHYQGLEYSRRLKANGVPTAVYMYDDNHSLSTLPAEMDNLINGAHWFLKHLQS